jgi:hypothetical protein
MSFSVRAVTVIAAVSLGALASQVLPPGPKDAPVQAANPAVEGETNEAPPQSPPRAERAGDLPLRHAILRDEKDDDSIEARILKTLGKPTTVEFIDLPLEDCITFLKEYHNVNIWLHKTALTDEGVALDQPITLRLAEVRLESVLNLLLEPAQLDWIVEDEVMKITPRSWADRHPETRTYDIHNLVAAGHKPEDLIASITKCVAPSSWTGKDAVAGISHTGGVLVVRQSQRVHSEILRLIDELDEIAESHDEGGAVKEARTAAFTLRHVH